VLLQDANPVPAQIPPVPNPGRVELRIFSELRHKRIGASRNQFGVNM